jgi:hypothetical protein
MVTGLIHVNKSASTDPLTTIMASRAFTAVARSVLFVMVDPQDEQTRLLGQPKNNLGRSDLPTLAFQISGTHVAETDEGPVWTGKLHWTGETERSIREALQEATEVVGLNRTVVSEAADWLDDYLKDQKDHEGWADSAKIKSDGLKAGHGKDALQRARLKLKLKSVNVGFPRKTHWGLSSYPQPPDQSSQPSGESATTATTATTGGNTSKLQSSHSPVVDIACTEPDQSLQSSQSCETPREGATTDRDTTTDAPEMTDVNRL